MDLALECTSGRVTIGNFGRVMGEVILVGTCIVGSAVLEWRMRPGLQVEPVPTLLLSSASFYMLQMQWRTSDGECFLDRMSAVMSGLLTIPWRGAVLIFDIKSWRFYAYDPEKTRDSPLHRGIQLHRIR
ncbi:hypothetical protein ACHHYP_20497 [Achlya hypogyna]|uniref:Uncharacterized protein n=1 Tax=Achlya hypogyna TaxID=1202772 RepID=A0A1V9YKS8_ACHHY|nr:hypothetical protein ACHHYP_20497 [Achlya hypogyna]